MRNRLLLAALALSCALAWFALASRPSPPRAPPALPATSTAAAPDELRPPRLLEDAQRIPTHHVLPGATRGFDSVRAPAAASEPRLHGLVLDARTARPIAGARASYPAPGQPGSPAVPGEAESGSDGRFELVLGAARGTGSAWLTAEGYGARAFVLDEAHDSPARPAVFELLAAASLEVCVRDEGGRAQVGLEVALDLEGAHGGFPPPWVAPSDARGCARFEGLPAEEALDWRVGALGSATRRMGRVVLAPGEARRLEVVVGSAQLAGVVRDEHGAPVEGVRVALGLAVRTRTVRQREWFARTDAAGRYAFPELGYERYVLGLAATEPEFVAHGRVVEVEAPEVTQDLALEHGLFLTGHVRGEAEQLARIGQFGARHLESGRVVGAALADGAFRVGPLPAGEYLISNLHGAVSLSVVRAPAGASGLELVVLAPRTLRVRAEGAERAFGLLAHDLEREAGHAWSPAPPALELAPGTYAFFARTEGERVAFRAGVTVPDDGPVPELVLAFEPCASVTLVHRGGPGEGRLRLTLAGQPFPFDVLGGLLVPGAARSLQLPAGLLEAELLEGGLVFARAASVLLPGARTRLELAPR